MVCLPGDSPRTISCSLTCYSAVIKPALTFGIGCAFGALEKGPVILTGGLFAISSLAGTAISLAVHYIGSKHNIQSSTLTKISACINLVLDVALCVAVVALGVFTPPLAASFLLWAFFAWVAEMVLPNDLKLPTHKIIELNT